MVPNLIQLFLVILSINRYSPQTVLLYWLYLLSYNMIYSQVALKVDPLL